MWYRKNAPWRGANFLAGAAALLLLTDAPALAQTASNVICNACVGASDIANGAVRSGEIANSTIVSADIKDGAIKAQDLANNAVTGAKILNNSITSVDLLPNLNLGKAGDDGDFTVKNAAGVVGVRQNGDNASVTNLYSSAASQSNGLVKAWAKLAADGTIVACWRCNTDPGLTQRASQGIYNVDFTPLAGDVRGRPRTATADLHGTGNDFFTMITLTDNALDFSQVTVVSANTSGSFTDKAFTLVIY